MRPPREICTSGGGSNSKTRVMPSGLEERMRIGPAARQDEVVNSRMDKKRNIRILGAIRQRMDSGKEGRSKPAEKLKSYPFLSRLTRFQPPNSSASGAHRQAWPPWNSRPCLHWQFGNFQSMENYHYGILVAIQKVAASWPPKGIGFGSCTAWVVALACSHRN